MMKDCVEEVKTSSRNQLTVISFGASASLPVGHQATCSEYLSPSLITLHSDLNLEQVVAIFLFDNGIEFVTEHG